LRSCEAQTSRLSQALDSCPEIHLSTSVGMRGETVSFTNCEGQG
jgi:hypothetical protein